MKKTKLIPKQSTKIEDAYALIGYSNVTHFSVAYKKHFGITPAKFIK